MFVYRGGHCSRFIRSETSFFHSLRSFREVVVNGGINLEWNSYEFLRIDNVCLYRWTLKEVSYVQKALFFIVYGRLGRWSKMEVSVLNGTFLNS